MTRGFLSYSKFKHTIYLEHPIGLFLFYYYFSFFPRFDKRASQLLTSIEEARFAATRVWLQDDWFDIGCVRRITLFRENLPGILTNRFRSSSLFQSFSFEYGSILNMRFFLFEWIFQFFTNFLFLYLYFFDKEFVQIFVFQYFIWGIFCTPICVFIEKWDFLSNDWIFNFLKSVEIQCVIKNICNFLILSCV